MQCTKKKCLSPTACQGFGYCRDLNRTFRIKRLWVPSNFHTQLTGEKPEFRTIKVGAPTKTMAERTADQHPEWFSDENAIVKRQPFII